MSKRKLLADDEDFQAVNVSNKKHTLDSDEEDSDDYERDDELRDSDLEGEEDGVADEQDDVKITPFNMRAELQEGHFDKDGHYHWNKDEELKDNWLDNIDWVKVKKNKNYFNTANQEDSNDSSTVDYVYNDHIAYAQVLEYMHPFETVQMTLQRLGKSRIKLSLTERLRRKKQGIVDEAGEKITKFTELVNDILAKTGNMNIYEETYENIKSKLSNIPGNNKGVQLDMFADEINKDEAQPSDNAVGDTPTAPKWEFKWKQDDSKVEGPFSTEEMLKWSQGNHFKDGVYVRKVGEARTFYSSKRIDFDLYL